MTKFSEFNEDLNKSDLYKNKSCEKCNRKYPETVLNIEGVIHHHGKYVCIDTKTCERIKRKMKRKK